MDNKYRNEQSFPFEAFIVNLGMYNKGKLIGEWLEFPTTYDKVQETLNRIGIGSGNAYEEYVIFDYECHIDNLYSLLGEYERIDELNYLAMKLDEMDKGEIEKFEQVIKVFVTDSLEDLINLTDNLEKFNYYPDVTSEKDLGHLYIDEYKQMNVPDDIKMYFDYEAYGRDASINEGGVFTEKGYINDSGADIQKEYERKRYSG